MKRTDIISFSFRDELERIRAATAGQAASRLIIHQDAPLVERHLSWHSDFCRACVGMGYLSSRQMQRAAQRYRLGMARDGGVIFWQVDLLGQVCDGKVMYYRPDCHRDHGHSPTWVSSELKRFYGCPVDHPPVHCLFGTHLVTHPQPLPCRRGVVESFNESGGRGESAVAIVESEKTAVIMSEHYPDCLWLAAGGLNELTPAKLFPLKGHKVILFPDTDTDCTAFSLWYGVAQKARQLLGQDICVSPLLEQRATPEQKRRKIDIADYVWEIGLKSKRMEAESDANSA